MSGRALDLFCGGPGGWSLALQRLGWEVLGIELDTAACASHHAAGHMTLQADVTTLDPRRCGEVEMLTASPPCTDYSRAGRRAGLEGESGHLVWEPLRWVRALRPRWVACEQVPDVLPIWRREAAELRKLGYSAWAGLLSAEQYGVPQTRQRAYLLAALEGTALPPPATHQRYRHGEPARAEPQGLFGEPLLPWVSMAEALGWGMTNRPSTVLVSTSPDGGPRSGGLDGGSGARRALRERQANGAWRQLDEPAMTIPASADNGNYAWVLDRPATVVQGDCRVFSPGGHVANDGRDNSRMVGRSEGAIPITVAEALTLQGFPATMHVAGTKTAQFRQIGNAVCPPVAEAIIRQLTSCQLEEVAS